MVITAALLALAALTGSAWPPMPLGVMAAISIAFVAIAVFEEEGEAP